MCDRNSQYDIIMCLKLGQVTCEFKKRPVHVNVLCHMKTRVGLVKEFEHGYLGNLTQFMG